jgi:putative membrane protein
MMSVIGALVALRHWMRLSARGRVRGERRAVVVDNASRPTGGTLAAKAASTGDAGQR